MSDTQQLSQKLKIYNHYLQTLFRGFACAQWKLINTYSLKKELVSKGAIFQTTSDTELILQLVARSRQKTH